MFDRKTVFILGAGASWHYNYPTGEDLIECIIKKTNIIIGRLSDPTEYTWFEALPAFLNKEFSIDFGASGNLKAYLKNFIDRLRHVDPPVIDYFLDWNPDLQKFAQMIIAWVILDREREYNQLGHGNRNHIEIWENKPLKRDRVIRNDIDCTKFKDNWYRFILYKMLSKCKNSDDVKTKNHINFITFNYDVSLETHLYKGLKQIKFMKDDLTQDEAKSILEDKFIHMYGSVREHPFIDPIQFIPEISRSRDNQEFSEILKICYEASKGIKPITALKADDGIKSKCNELISEVEDIYILGYGFDENNNDNMMLKENLVYSAAQKISSKKRRVFITNFGDKNSINKKISKIINGSDQIIISGQKPVLPFKEYVPSFDCIYELSTRNVYEALEQDFGFVD